MHELTPRIFGRIWASIISLNIVLAKKQLPVYSLIECLVDSQSAAGWLEESNFSCDQPLKLHLVQFLVMMLASVTSAASVAWGVRGQLLVS